MEYLEEPYSASVASGVHTWESLRKEYANCPPIVALCNRKLSEAEQRAQADMSPRRQRTAAP